MLKILLDLIFKYRYEVYKKKKIIPMYNMILQLIVKTFNLHLK